jgi:hypothetical protein
MEPVMARDLGKRLECARMFQTDCAVAGRESKRAADYLASAKQ